MARVESDDSFWVGTVDQIVERILGYQRLGFITFFSEIPAPFDDEIIERLIGEVNPVVARPEPVEQGDLVVARPLSPIGT